MSLGVHPPPPIVAHSPEQLGAFVATTNEEEQLNIVFNVSVAHFVLPLAR